MKGKNVNQVKVGYGSHLLLNLLTAGGARVWPVLWLLSSVSAQPWPFRLNISLHPESWPVVTMLHPTGGM